MEVFSLNAILDGLGTYLSVHDKGYLSDTHWLLEDEQKRTDEIVKTVRSGWTTGDKRKKNIIIKSPPGRGMCMTIRTACARLDLPLLCVDVQGLDTTEGMHVIADAMAKGDGVEVSGIRPEQIEDGGDYQAFLYKMATDGYCELEDITYFRSFTSILFLAIVDVSHTEVDAC